LGKAFGNAVIHYVGAVRLEGVVLTSVKYRRERSCEDSKGGYYVAMSRYTNAKKRTEPGKGIQRK
jgi:hypothetical protein